MKLIRTARWRKLKILLMAFFVCQLTWSMLAEDLLGTENIFPVFNWKIFHTRPDKMWNRTFVYIHQLDGKVFEPAQELFPIIDQFPSVNYYTLASKIWRLGDNNNEEERKELIEQVNENLIRDHQSVDWELFDVRYELISFYLTGKYESRTSLGTYSLRAGERIAR